MEIELRTLGQIEFRDADGDKPPRVEGYAAVFDSDSADLGGFVETIRPGAFKESLERGDEVKLKIEHRDLPLASRQSGTLEVVEDTRGLRIASDLDPTDPDVARVLPKLRRRDLRHMSFGFIAEADEWDFAAKPARRSLVGIGLREVSIVSDPAYQATEIALRTLEAKQGELDEAKRKAAHERRERLLTVAEKQ